MKNMFSDLFARRWRGLPVHGWAGLVLIAAFWFLNWSLTGLRTLWGFFPLWLGYCLFVDALVCIRKGDSLLTRNAYAYAGLFAVSAPAWWLFELLNRRLQNWLYLGVDGISDLAYVLFSSLSFSTVIPAVFGTAELAGTFRWIGRFRNGPRLAPTPTVLKRFLAVGVASLLALLLWPRYFFPLVWLAVYLILEPFNGRFGYRSLLADTASGDWRGVFSLWTGCLICGFFWEMWNILSYPKWIYHVPFVDFCRIFEMPVLGYGGYIPFSLELFALYHLITGLATRGRPQDYVELTPDADRARSTVKDPGAPPASGEAVP